MRTFRLLTGLCLVAGLLLGAEKAAAQDVNTQGRDFWVSFLPNWLNDVPKLEILVAGKTPCTGTVSNPVTGWSAAFQVTPGEVTSVRIPNAEGLMEKPNRIEHKALHVVTTEDVSLYASNFVPHSYDVSNVLPTVILQGNYIAQAYPTGEPGSDDITSKMLIVGVEDGTEVTIDPRGGLKGSFPVSKKRTVTLDAGDCYLCTSATGDISGTTVNVKDGKKVAVFSGSDTQIPASGCCYDAVFEQCVPLAYWGRHFVVTASAHRTNDMVRITSLASGCRISIDGKHKKTLGAGKHYDYKLDSTRQEAIYVSASSPVAVCLIMTSASMGGDMGDPSMVNINPIEQQMDKVTFCSYNTEVSNLHYVNVVTQTSQVGGMTLDGDPIASSFSAVPYKPELSYARIKIAHGSHTLEAQDGGFVAHIYGLGSCESYAYTVGSNSKVLNQFDEEGNLLASIIPDDPLEPEEPEPEEPEPEEPEEVLPPPVPVRTDTLATVEMGGITLERLRQGEGAQGRLPGAIDPSRYDISARSDVDYLLEGIDVQIDGDALELRFRPRRQWCDCFMPQKIRAEVLLEPLEGGNRIVIPVEVPVEREAPWLRRCRSVLLLVGGLLLLLLYLIPLSRKKRFKKSAMITPSYTNYRGRAVELGGSCLRKEGFGPWLARWFWPGTERRSLAWNSPEANLSFEAAPSNDTVYLPKEGNIDPTTMKIAGYDPRKDPRPRQPVKLGNNGKITILDAKGSVKGYLVFTPGSTNDGSLFKALLAVLVAADILAILALLGLIVRGLL